MLEFFVSLVVGWPAILLSVILVAIGLWRRNHRLLIAAAFVALPFSWTLGGFPVIRSPIFLLPVLPFAAAFALSRGREMIAWLLALPFFLTVLSLFYLILAQP